MPMKVGEDVPTDNPIHGLYIHLTSARVFFYAYIFIAINIYTPKYISKHIHMLITAT